MFFSPAIQICHHLHIHMNEVDFSAAIDDAEQKEKFHSFVEEADEVQQLVASLKNPANRTDENTYRRLIAIVRT